MQVNHRSKMNDRSFIPLAQTCKEHCEYITILEFFPFPIYLKNEKHIFGDELLVRPLALPLMSIFYNKIGQLVSTSVDNLA